MTIKGNIHPWLASLLLSPLLCAGLTPAIGRAGELDMVGWNSDVKAAWQKSQLEQRPMLVYVTHSNCIFCVKMKSQTWTDPRVARAVRAGYVPLTVDATAPSPLIKELAVSSYPTTFVISPQAVILARIDGYIAPEVLVTRLATARTQPVPRVAQGP